MRFYENFEVCDTLGFSRSLFAPLYRIPLDGDVHYLHVRKDVLDRFNLPVPETWDEFLSVASQVLYFDPNRFLAFLSDPYKFCWILSDPWFGL